MLSPLLSRVRARRSTTAARTRVLRAVIAGPVALTAALGTAAWAPPAHADDADTVQGTLVRAYSEGPSGVPGVAPFLVSAGTVGAIPTGPFPICPICGQPILGPDHAASHILLSWIDSGSSAVRVPAADVASIPDGATVRVQLGAQVPDENGALTGDDARDVLGAQVVSTRAGTYGLRDASTPEHGVTVVMAVPAGGTRDSMTLAAVTSTVNGPVSDYWSSQTGGRVHLSVTQGVNWVNLSSGCSDPVGMWNQAAAAAHWTAGPGKHLLVYLSTAPSTLSGCAAGLAEVGDSVDRGGRLYVRNADPSVLPSVVAHEIGHNLGLRHAASLQCDASVEGPESTCLRTTYRDYYDVMGASWGQLTALSGFEATQLGVMDAGARRDVSASGGSGVVTLAPVGASSGVRAVRLSDGTGGTYWVELRGAVGRDAYLGSAGANWLHLDAGVVVRREGAAGQDATYLLDGTPAPRGGWSADGQQAVRAGTTLPLGSGGWYLTVRAVGGGSATVDVRRGAAPTSDAAPTPTPPPAAPLVPMVPVVRYQGGDRYDTAARIATAAHPSGSATVVVASGQDFPDALSAGPSAAQAHAALLLVPAGGTLPATVTDALARLAPSVITVVGGPASVGSDVVDQLGRFAPVTRVAGADRYATAAAVAATGGATTGGTVYLASGAGYADALAGGALAAGSGDRLLLTTAGTLPDVTATALVALAPSRVVLLGGADTVGDAIAAAVAAAVPTAAVVRWSGDDRYATAADAATRGYPGGAATVYLASGANFPDAVAGAPSAGGQHAPLLLTQPGCAPASTIAAVTALHATSVVVLGGSDSVSERAADLVACS